MTNQPATQELSRAPVRVNVPDAMRQYRQFINWRQVGGDKLPVDANGEVISAQDASKWLSYDDASATGRPIGFVFTPQDPFVFVDLDGCRTAPGGPLSDFATTVRSWFPHAGVETSISGTGMHLFVHGAGAIIGNHK